MIFIDYIFNNKYYRQVQFLYNEAVGKYYSAYKLWSEHNGVPEKNNYKTKKLVAEHFSEIKEIAIWIKKYADILKEKKDALLWLYNKTGRPDITVLKYNDYRFIIDNENEINLLNGYMSTYKYLMQTQKEAVERFISSSSNSHSYDEIKKIALGKKDITRLTSILVNAHSCEEKYEFAWESFSGGRKFCEISMNELESVSEENFHIKNTYLKLYQGKANLIRLILGGDILPSDSFTKEAIEQEEKIVKILSSQTELIEPFRANIHLDNEDELKRAIMDSIYYGIKCRFSDSFTISDFYDYRAKFDYAGVNFDDACILKEKNIDAIKVFNKQKYDKSVVYISDYLDLTVDGSELSIFVNNYKQEQETRNKAKRIQQMYVDGFTEIFGIVDIDKCDLSLAIKIKESEAGIILEDNRFKEIKRQRLEHERKIREEQQRKQEIKYLKDCVSAWLQPTCSTVKCFSLFYYYPTTCDWDADYDEWRVRNLIWNFKASPNKPQQLSTIMELHRQASNIIVAKLVTCLTHFFGDKVSKLTFFCIPSSKALVTQRRYADFSEEICNILGMSNAYHYMQVEQDGEAKHIGGTIQAKYVFDENFFKGKYILLFDDVITSGRSMEKFKSKLEHMGAFVIGGVSIGRTRHERQPSNPIDALIGNNNFSNNDLPF